MSRWIATLALLCAGNIVLAQNSAEDGSGLARYIEGGFTDPYWGGGTELELQLSQGVPWRVFTLDDPARLVVDFREVDWSAADPIAMDASKHIASLRMGAFRPGWSRLVAEISTPMKVSEAGLSVAKDTGAAKLSLRLTPIDQSEFATLSGMPFDPAWDMPESVLRFAKPDDKKGPLTVLLDPGHGGIDPGAQRDGFDEADLMLLFAQELRDVLVRTGHYEVVLTREKDVFVSLEGRVAKAHDAQADLFISLHADALAEGVAHGASVYTLSKEASDAASAALAERHDRDDLLSGVDLSGTDDRVAQVLLDIARLDNSPRSDALAGHLVGGIRNALGNVHKRPKRQASFSVLKSADIPSVLIELGFLSTQRDLDNLRDPNWRAGMAAGIRDGINAWALEDEALSRLRRQ
ncbi:N-acetylmuramoyl-L-alanine amidase [uncultured Pelagimonas sp.]|uniref:N-acetylmuramoyl-L-alanine amidase n=1 Tax=uncultured Pelagimonas sp. TaxID=1618102 RepID=UPI002605132A|nr:N-acetylmuramoyl-L-alanine amidase [uncultured Pelagimonas sp.]